MIGDILFIRPLLAATSRAGLQLITHGVLWSCMRLAIKSSKPIILCIEDNEGYLRLRRAVLEQNGYSVLAATTGIEALNRLRHSPVSLVISDHMLGDTSGTELAKEIRKIRPKVPIMLYSGVMPEHLGDVNCFLSKMEPIEDFLTMIASLVSH